MQTFRVHFAVLFFPGLIKIEGMDMGTAAEPSQTMTDFVAAVNDKMERSKVSKSELARRTGIAVEHLRALLNGRGGSCKLSTADEIAEALGTSVLSLLQSARRAERQRASV